MTDTARSSSPQQVVSDPGVDQPKAMPVARVYFRVYLRILLIAVPIMWTVAMATSMSFLRANTVEGLATGLTASIVVALLALVLVTVLALSHLAVLSLTIRNASDHRDWDGYIVTASNCLLLVLWAAIVALQHLLGANLFFWKLFGIDEPYPLINPDVDSMWSIAFHGLVACTVFTSIVRRIFPSHPIAWLALTTSTAIAWLVLVLTFSHANNLINDRISIAALEGTVTWWMPGGEGGTMLVIAAALIGFFRVRSAWLAVSQPA